MKKFKNKKGMYEYVGKVVSETFNVTRTGQQCSSRYKTIIKRKTKAKCHNNTSGNSPSDVPFENEIEKIKAQDDSLEPEELRDSYGVIFKKYPYCAPKTNDSAEKDSVNSGQTSSESQGSEGTTPGSSLLVQEPSKTSVPRLSSARSLEIKAFFDQINAVPVERAEQRAAQLEEKKKYREHKAAIKEEHRKERAEQHSQRMALLNRILGVDMDEV